RRGVGWVPPPAGVLLPRNARIDFAVLRLHGEHGHLAIERILRRQLRRWIVGWANDEIPILGGRRQLAVRQFFGFHVAGRIWIARRCSGATDWRLRYASLRRRLGRL